MTALTNLCITSAASAFASSRAHLWHPDSVSGLHLRAPVRLFLQIGEQETFISELLNELTQTIQDLETHQIHMFYEAVGLMIGADANPDKQRHYLASPLMLSHCTVCAFAACWVSADNAAGRHGQCLDHLQLHALPVAVLQWAPALLPQVAVQ